MSQIRNQSIYDQGFARVAAVSLRVQLADPLANASQIIAAARQCAEEGAAVVVFPEMATTGYSVDDLVTQRGLLAGAVDAIEAIREQTADLASLLVVGTPLEYGPALYNCAVVFHRGQILGVVPKSHLPSYREFYDKRYFSTLPDPLGSLPRLVTWRRGLHPLGVDTPQSTPGIQIVPAGDSPKQPVYAATVPFGQFLVNVSDIPGLTVGVEICEDAWVPIPPSAIACLQGATVIANPSASPVTVGRSRVREELVEAHSGSFLCAYVYAASGFGESSNDLSWDGQCLVFEDALRLAESPRFVRGKTVVSADIDLRLLQYRRLKQNSFADNAKALDLPDPYVVSVALDLEVEPTYLERRVAQFPFIPSDEVLRDQDSFEAFNIQVDALVRRMESIGSPKLILGVSGGLDSTQALLVAARAMDSLGRPRTDILAYTMPGYGTTEHTRNNAEALCRNLGVTFQELDIRPTAQAMLQEMGHPFGKGEPVYDVTFENVQAGLRTDYLFRLAGYHGGIVVGTGDMSELALGWCTFGVGDHMSHYGVNAGLPKTMIRHLIRWVAENEEFAGDLSEVLESILDTEISPELIPATDGNGGPGQSTEAAIGPYELQDFTLYWLLRGGFTPSRVAYLQAIAWGEKYSDEELLKWLEVFHRRFFANQYKRSTVPNAPKIMDTGSLSPRGDWRIPSDASSKLWLDDLRKVRALVDQDAPDSTVSA